MNSPVSPEATGDGKWPASPLDAVLFDLDGTLADSASSIAASLNVVRAGRGGSPIPVSTISPWVSLSAVDMVARALAPFGAEPVADLEEFRVVYHAWRATPDELFPGATAVVNSLHDKGIKLAICTNKPQHLTEKLLDEYGIAPFFGAVVGGQAGRRSKPDPDIVQTALLQLGVVADRVVFVGDSEVDAEAAEKMNIPFILARYGYAIGDLTAIPRATVIDTLFELPRVLGLAG